MNLTLESTIKNYPFLNYLKEDKSHYKHAKDAGYDDPDDLFLIGDSGGFLMNIDVNDRFVNTHLFTEAADTYRKYGYYTNFKVDSIPHRQWRKREEDRRKHGYSAPCLLHNGVIKNIRITGDHYNFLNYTQIEQLNEKSIKHTKRGSVAEKHRDFSKFIDAQFWTFHVIDFARRNGFHIIIDKTRRGGFSYIMAARTANALNLQPKKVVINVAYDKAYLTATGGLTDFAINNLNFYESETPFVRGIYSTDKENFKLGFKQKDGKEAPKSWGSTLFSKSALNHPDCAIGKDAIMVNVEELSTMENFDEFMLVTDPAMRTGSYTTGLLCCWGTATNADMTIFESNFYNPHSNHFMPFENVWDTDSRNEQCGFFKPYAWGLQGQIGDRYAMDKDGNSDLELSLQVAFNERVTKQANSKTTAEYINYLGQYALQPAESFSSATENIFTSEDLSKWEEILRTDNDYKFYTDGIIELNGNKATFKSNAMIKANGGKFNKDYYDYIEGVPKKPHEHHHGCIRIWFHPMEVMHENKGKIIKGVPPGLYSISYDPVGVNKENKAITNKNSHNSIKVWMNPCSVNNFKTALVACYYGRPETLEEADKICLQLATYYNCIGTTGVEVNRGETVSNFKKWGALKYLMKDPVEIWNTSLKGGVVASYGVTMGDSTKKLEGLRLLKEMLYSVIGKDDNGNDKYLFQTIYDYQTILELKKWNPIGNFDRVSEMIIRALQWKARDINAQKELSIRKKIDKNNILQRNWF